MEGDKKESKPNENRLVTVAIHSNEKAQILKTILESEGIESVIHGINLIEPTIPGSVRVRIKERDLQRALRVIEQVDFTSKVVDEEEGAEVSNKEVLIPVDFSDYTLLICEFGFKLANDLNATNKDLYQDVRRKTEFEMNSLHARIDKYISKGYFPKVSYTSILTEGLPEEEIISYSKKMKPVAIVMGTKGKNAKELDLIGSVTAEVIDGCKTPIFAVPEDAKTRNISEIKRLVFLTNFQEWLLLVQKKSFMKTLLKYTSDLDQLSTTEENDLAKAIRSVEKFIESRLKND